ncbi:hemerythrin family protein [Campylobacter sp. IFREMER_LSEM_CL1085]|uniref:hemerythrin family protein n=1 Tax=Campylobacter sp. IFREMER_LSEM_CL1085 TaxID=2911612 RepID=UPI0021E63CEC|nr:hemerythrin family protein [Campylobacter sp. IFREMER_LSEM_CL1085]MCV3424954.1 hemerythrin family protein [Campylobacter sp. IFREMER_LSEM_CL1085]
MKKIDLQHQRFFALTLEVFRLSNRHIYKTELKKVLMELFSYMKNHFDNEEEYMREIKYPYLDEHIIMHKNIVKSMKSLLYECCSTNGLKNELYNIVSSWFFNHFSIHDMKIRDYVQNSSNQNLSKQNEMIKSEEIFEYTCDCIGVIHKVNYDLHMKINYLNIS